MKRSIFLAIMVSGLTLIATLSAIAQQDSTKKDINYGKGVNINLEGGDNGLITRKKRDTLDDNKGRFVGGITFTRLDLGISKLIDNGSFSLSPANKFLAYKAAKTSHLSFDVLQMGYRFNTNFKIYVAGGFDWTFIRLKEHITMQKNTANLTYITEPIAFSKNRFSSSYLHIPLNFELRTKENEKGRRWYLVIGPEVGFLLNGKVKQISDERGKEKFKDDYNFAPFRYGGTLRVGTNGLALFAKYYASDMFDSAPQKGLKNMAFGLTIGLN
jgi:hypothetical protein